MRTGDDDKVSSFGFVPKQPVEDVEAPEAETTTKEG